MQKYRTILADPPWSSEQNGLRGAARHYDLLSTRAIAGLAVSVLAEDDAHLWMWATNSALDEQVGVMEAWGFEYRAALTWIKPYFRLGNYLRHQTEHLLFGTRGRLPIQFRSQGTWFYAPLQDQSHKPEEQYAIIERCSPGPYVELFARRRQPNWDAIGNEIDGRDIRSVLKDYATRAPS